MKLIYVFDFTSFFGLDFFKFSSPRCAGPPQDEKNWCGPGCGYDVCVQPGTTPEAFYEYFEQFPAGPAWLEGLTINNFEK